MSEAVVVFVNERAVRMPPGSTAEAAVAALDAGLGEKLREGAAYVTDGRGIRLESGEPVYAGAILRVVVSARREGARDEADAHP
jgi:hypothetical protein